MSRALGIFQGTLAGLLIGVGTFSDDITQAIANKRAMQEESYVSSDMSMFYISAGLTVGAYASAGGFAIAGIGNVTRRREED